MTGKQFKQFTKDTANGHTPTWLMGLAGIALYLVGMLWPDQRAFTDGAVLSLVGAMLNVGRVGHSRDAAELRSTLPQETAKELYVMMGAQGQNHKNLVETVEANREACDATSRRTDDHASVLCDHATHLEFVYQTLGKEQQVLRPAS